MDYTQAEQGLMLGILDALPCPTALLNREGQTVYVNERPCPVSLEVPDFTKMAEVKTALEGVAQSAFRAELRGAAGAVSGLMEAYPVKSGGMLVGALVLFRPDPVSDKLTYDAIPTESEAMVSVWERIQRLALLNTPALILGEEGLGKTDFAKALHLTANKGQNRPFITVDENTTSDGLKDAALEAKDGTLFFKRIDTWSNQMVWEAAVIYATRSVIRGTEKTPIAARLFASAEPSLAEMAKRGDFPEALFARMNIMPVFLPPLRDRRDDIVPAALRFAAARASETGKDIQGFSEDAQDVMARQDWTGNLTVLQKAVDSAVDACPGGIILSSYLSFIHQPDGGTEAGSLRKMRAAYGRDHARAMLNVHGNTVAGKKKAAAEMGISLATLYRILGSKK